MAYRRAIEPVAFGGALLCLGAVALAAYWNGMWGTMLGAALAAIWIVALGGWRATRIAPSVGHALTEDGRQGEASLHLVLDQLPVPLVETDGKHVTALNRAARRMFAADDRIIPPPLALLGADLLHLIHQGRRFRIDRIELGRRIVAALIDVEAEERTAEARATAEMIQVLGHEMLNGLAPIVSLAESGLAAIDGPARREDLLPEILGTLARRAEGLLRFSEAYRSMARLPDPVRAPVAISTLAADLTRLFSGRWAGAVTLEIDVSYGTETWIDGDQITQAVWALLQNGAEAALASGGNPRVSLAIRQRDESLVIDVRDTGHGIAPDDIVHIFRPFYTTKAGGTGVGLSLARQIILAHGGELILLDNKPATFQMMMPCSQKPSFKPSASSRRGQSTSGEIVP